MRINETKKLYFKPELLFVFAFSLFGASVNAQTPADLAQIKQVVLDGLENGKTTQMKIDDIDDQRAKLANDYRATLKQNANLEKYNNILRQTIESQKNSIEEFKQQIDSVSGLEKEIVPLMSEMLDTLQSFIALDLPFLLKERKHRVENLKSLLSNGDTTNSEKYRRILEAYQIENDYGRTIEAYEDILIAKDGSKRTVTFFKVGRIAFFYQTLDRSQTFVWLKEQRKWQRLDNRYNAQIYNGIKMAKELIPSNLMFIPIDTSTISSAS